MSTIKALTLQLGYTRCSVCYLGLGLWFGGGYFLAPFAENVVEGEKKKKKKVINEFNRV